MPEQPNESPAHTEQMKEIHEILEEKKVLLTKEVEDYINQCTELITDKLVNNEDIYTEDMEFVEEVKMWIVMPEEWREKYPSIEEMKKANEVQDTYKEAGKRMISMKQWLDLLHVAESAKKDKEWIDETFTFPGSGKIEVGGYLDLMNCTSLTSLPDNLSIGVYLYLSDCTSLTILPDNLSVGDNLNLINCTSLTTLPDNLSVEEDLYLTDNLNEQVKKDAERLKKEGKIRGEIKYIK